MCPKESSKEPHSPKLINRINFNQDIIKRDSPKHQTLQIQQYYLMRAELGIIETILCETNVKTINVSL